VSESAAEKKTMLRLRSAASGRRSPTSAAITLTVFTRELDSVFREILAACGCALTG
jgi:hypothetical protein